MTISCQPDGRPPQPVRPWKSGRVHLAEGSNVVVLELPADYRRYRNQALRLAKTLRKRYYDARVEEICDEVIAEIGGGI